MKTATKNTHIATVRQENSNGMETVCHLLQWTEQQYCDYLFEQYCAFIDNQFHGEHLSLKNRVFYSKYFRGMFNNAAAYRDESEFIPYALEVTEEILTINDKGSLEVIPAIPMGGTYLADEWMHIHHHKRMINDCYFMNQYKHILHLIKVL